MFYFFIPIYIYIWLFIFVYNFFNCNISYVYIHVIYKWLTSHQQRIHPKVQSCSTSSTSWGSAMVLGCEKTWQRWEVRRSQVEATERRELPVGEIQGKSCGILRYMVCKCQGKNILEEDPRWSVSGIMSFPSKAGKAWKDLYFGWCNLIFRCLVWLMLDGNRVYSKIIGILLDMLLIGSWPAQL